MKHLSSWRAAVLLFAPLLLLAALMVGPAGISHGQFSGPIGVIVVGFTGTLPEKFQNMSFNIQAVRLNPSTDPSVSDADPNWVTVPVPQGVGLNSTGVSNPFNTLATLFSLNTSGPSPTQAGTGPSELQIDMGQIANLPQMFNSWSVPSSTYNQIELVLDSASAGNVIPNCFSGGLEGCINSQIAMFNPSPILRTSGQVTVPLGGVATLVININPIANDMQSQPPFSGANYTLNPTISVTPFAPKMALVTGQAVGATQVLAELSDTNQVVETTTLGDSFYTMVLPAALGGTLYDFVASGPGFAYKVAHNVLIKRGQSKTVNLNSGFSGQTSLSGKITDGCSGQPIEGATVELEDPSTGVVLISAGTDDTGAFPMPRASNLVLQPFTSVANGSYTLVVSAAGYDTHVSPLSVAGGNAVIGVALGRSQINGLVSLNAPLPAGASALNVLVTAEDHGTHHIENVALATIPPGSSAAPFSMFVPDNSGVAALDMFAAVSDLFGGLPEKYTGHTIAVTSNIPSAGGCAVNPVNPIFSMQCVGHASLIGQTTSFDPGMSVVLSKDGVQLIASNVVAATPNPSASPSPVPGRFSFCAPADPQPYTLQRFETSPPGAAPSPAASPTSVTMLPPGTVNPPCSSICGNGSGLCLVCRNKPNVSVP